MQPFGIEFNCKKNPAHGVRLPNLGWLKFSVFGGPNQPAHPQTPY